MKYRFTVMFLIVLCGMISIAAFNPIIGPLSRNLGLSELQSGCLVSVAGLCWLLGGYFWEKQTFMSRKKMLASIMFVYLITLVVFALLADYAADHWQGSSGLFWIFLLLRAVAGFFFGGIPAKAQAYVMGWTTQETRTKGMALFGAANGLGFVLGPAMSGGMASIGLTAPMYAVAIMLALMILLGLLIKDEPEQKTIRSAKASSLSPLDGRIRLYLWTGLMLSFALNIVQVTIGFYVQDNLGYDARQATQLIGLGLALSGVMVVLSQIVISKLKWKSDHVLRVGLLFVVLGLLGLVAFIRYAYVDFLLLGIGIGFTLLGYSAGASLAVRDEEQRSVASYIAALQGGGSFLGPVTGTALYTANIAAPYSFCVLLICVTGLFSLRRKTVRVPSDLSQ